MTDDSGSWTFEYNADGLRVYRSNGTNEYKYYYNGDKLTRMVVNGQNITFGYDANGTPQYVLYDGNRYFYLTNLQGDVTAIVSVNGNIVVEYTYDAWGNVLSIDGVRKDNLGKLNPLRYRGYVNDEETRLYYISSRYYDPEIGRWINADAFPSTGQSFVGNNMFAYCGNNPVNRNDVGGFFWDTAIDVVSLCFSVAAAIENPGDPMARLSVAADVASLVVPFVSGGGTLVRTAAKTDDVIDTVKAINTAENTATTAKKLHRPYIRKSTRQAVEQAAKKAPDGRFLDANTSLPINGKYDLGHVYGHEFRRERDQAMARGWSQKQFNDYMNNPSFYQIEDPILNRSHIFEMR